MKLDVRRFCLRAAHSAGALLLASVLLTPALATDPHGNQYRLISGGTASVSAHASSPNNQLYVVGGSGQPVGESSSTNISSSGGGVDNTGPTERLFHGTFEG
jgi:hypothetical protein